MALAAGLRGVLKKREKNAFTVRFTDKLVVCENGVFKYYAVSTEPPCSFCLSHAPRPE